MAKEEPTKSEVPMWIKVAIGVALFGLTIYGISQSSGKEAGAHVEIVNSHEKRITTVEYGLTKVVDRVTSTEKMQISLQKDQQSLLDGQREIKEQNKLDAQIGREQRKDDVQAIRSLEKAVVGLDAYLKSIETIEPSIEP